MTKEEIDKLVDNLPDLTCNQGRYVIVKECDSQCFEYLLEDGTLIKSDNGAWSKLSLKYRLEEGYKYIGLGYFHKEIL